MKIIVLSQVLLYLVLGCTNPATQPANTPPNPPIVVDVVNNILYQTTLNLTITFSDPKDPDSSDTVHMAIVESKLIDSSGNIIGDVPTDLLTNANPRFTDATTGDFSIDGLTNSLIGYNFTYMGIIIYCVDQNGEASDTAMIRVRFFAT